MDMMKYNRYDRIISKFLETLDKFDITTPFRTHVNYIPSSDILRYFIKIGLVEE